METNLSRSELTTILGIAGGMYLGIALGYFTSVATPWLRANNLIARWVADVSPFTLEQEMLGTAVLALVLGTVLLYYTLTNEAKANSSTRVDA